MPIFTGSAYFSGNNQSIIGTNEPVTNTKKPVAKQQDYPVANLLKQKIFSIDRLV
jgi:hypothetical protein